MAGTGESAKSPLKRDWPREGRMGAIGPHSAGAGSADALRESRARLAADGWVESEGQRGFTVRPASLADLIDITETRRLLECHAARLSVGRADLEWQSRLVAAYD